MIDLALNEPDTVILAEDEASLYLQATTMAVWAPKGQTPIVRLDPGRDKVSFYGTLALKTGQEFVSRTTTMNSEATANHLQQVLSHYPDQKILLLWDRAKWHQGQVVKDLLTANPRLEVIFLPTASPDLNPQEMIWKKARRAVSHNHSFPKLPALADAFEDFLTSSSFPSSFLDLYALDRICPGFI